MGPRSSISFIALLSIGSLVAQPACRHSLHSGGGHTPVGGTSVSASAPPGPPIEGFSFGVVTANLKVRPHEHPPSATMAKLQAGRNEFEAFQLLFHSANALVRGVSVVLTSPLSNTTTGAKIPAGNITLYRVAYYDVGTPSNDEGAAGPWPDPLIPDRDTYVGERRNAFPFDVARGRSQVVWVDLLVPKETPPGDYRGVLEVRVSGLSRGTVPIALQVGNFTLPSSASLRSAFGMDYAQPCMAHTETDSCDPDWDEEKACLLRERYLRAGLDHRFTISDVAFQPPFEESAKPFERLLLPLIQGTGRTRLAGAMATAVRVDDQPDQATRWIAYAQKRRFADRLFFYPVREPDGDANKWKQFVETAGTLRQMAQVLPLAVTATIDTARQFKADERVDIFVAPIESLDPRGAASLDAHRSDYDGWQKEQSRRQVWGYQSCMSHGCGECGGLSAGPAVTGWPTRVIDSSAVQNRAFPWLAYIHRLAGEFYAQVTDQLSTAWSPNGQCRNSGSGDGTLFYPGKPSIIGGKTDIPIESIRMKLIREGMEDYEYLKLASERSPEQARAIALGLFPRAFECAQPANKLEEARAKLFQLIDG